MEIQPSLFEQKEPSVKTLNHMVLCILRAGDWWVPHELCANLKDWHNIMVSDSSVTARIRDLRKSQYGSHIIEKRKRVGSKAFEYRLAK